MLLPLPLFLLLLPICYFCSRSFIEHRDGSYELALGEREPCPSVPGRTRIKAHELKTFLKVDSCWSNHLGEYNLDLQVGQTLPDQKELTPFIIEWIPDILPFMKIGELRIKFE